MPEILPTLQRGVTKRIARIRLKFTCNSHGSCTLYKQDRMDTLGIHMGPSTLWSRSARMPEESTWVVQPLQRWSHGYRRSFNLGKGDCADRYLRISHGSLDINKIARIPRNSHASTSNSQGRSTKIILHGSSQETFETVPSIFRGVFCHAKHAISRLRHLSKTHFVRDLLQRLQVEVLKTKLSHETSLKTFLLWSYGTRKYRLLNFLGLFIPPAHWCCVVLRCVF